jgi:hypothetical protein
MSDILDWSIQNATRTTAQIAAATNIFPKVGQLVYNTDNGKYAIGDGTTALSALTFYGGVSSSGLTVGTSTITSGTNTRILYNNSGVVGEYAVTGTGTTAVLSTSPTFTTDITTPLIIGGTAVGSTIQYKGTSGVGTSTVAAHQFLVGNNGATSAVMIYNDASLVIGGNRIWQGMTSGHTTSNYSLYKDASTTILNSGTSLLLRTNNNNNNIISISLGNISFTPSTANSNSFLFTIPSGATGLTASTERVGFQIDGGSKTWLAGTLSLQQNTLLTTPTYSFASASTLTLASNLSVQYVQGGSLSTITTSAAIYVPTLALTNTTTGIGCLINAPSGGTSFNYAYGSVGNSVFQGKVFISDSLTQAPTGLYDLEITKALNGGVESWVRNTTSGTAAFAQWGVRTDGTTQLKMGVLSSAYTTSGLLTAQTSFLMTAGTSINKILIGHQSIAKDIMFINGGTATTDVAFGIEANKNVYIGNAALATTATNGFLYVTSCAGVPTGVPTAITGRIPIVADSTNNKLYIYSGGAWVALN